MNRGKGNIPPQQGMPHHLPNFPIDPAAYRQLYRFNGGLDDYMEDDPAWREIRIPPGLSASAVYQLLPSSPTFEYGGYLTRTRIRYAAFDSTRAATFASKACTFHSHPTALPGVQADVPSIQDIYFFLKWRHLRAITVGASIVWVFDKTRATLRTVRRLAAWERHDSLQVARSLIDKDPHGWPRSYMKRVLHELGLQWPRGRKLWEAAWPELVQRALAIKVTVFERND